VPDLIEYRLNTQELVRARVSDKVLTGVQLAADPVAIAVVAKGATPAAGDFQVATWVTPPEPNAAIAERLYVLTEAGTFDVYTKVTDTTEVPIKLAGQIRVK
jgi:hypothetical protein